VITGHTRKLHVVCFILAADVVVVVVVVVSSSPSSQPSSEPTKKPIASDAETSSGWGILDCVVGAVAVGAVAIAIGVGYRKGCTKFSFTRNDKAKVYVKTGEGEEG
jgi:hypothetical protein